MAPAPVLMDVDQEEKPGSSVKSSMEKENRIALKVEDDVDLRCTNNCEDNTFHAETFLDQQKIDEMLEPEVNIIDCVDTSVRFTKVEEDPDATEYSSSFGNTMSGSEDGLRVNSSDDEVESRLCHDNGSSSMLDGFGKIFWPRKKKLTAHWRRYIRPLMWRCKWLELRMKELQRQALKYDSELLRYTHEKQLKEGQIALDDCVARTVPLPCLSHGRRVMRRRKRKRLEDTLDIRSYMSHHNLFSYYENRKSEADGISIDDDYGNHGNMVEQDMNNAYELKDNHEWLVFESKKSNNFFEQILWNIDLQQSRVIKLKDQLDKLILKNAGRSSSVENLALSVQGDAPAGSTLNHTLSSGDIDETPVGALCNPLGHVSEYAIGDLVMNESQVSSFGEVAALPDTIESTVGLLSACDMSMDHPHAGDSCEDVRPSTIADDVLIHNQSSHEELLDLETVGQPLELVNGPSKEEEELEGCAPAVSAPEPTTSATNAVPIAEPGTASAQPTLKACLASKQGAPRNKRKRGGYRGGGLGRLDAKKAYSRRSSAGKDKQRIPVWQ